MKFYDVDPQSAEWKALRLGVCTSSNFHKILTPTTLKYSSQSEGYMMELLAEWVTGEQVENYKSEFMQRGNDLEDQIWKAYEGYAEVETKRGGFFTDDAGLIGCSPDRLIGDDGDLEAKAPLIHTQIGYALNGLGVDYRLQLQGRLYIHGREYVDIFPWHPLLFIKPLRVTREEKVQAALKDALTQFTDRMLERRLKLETEYGPFTRPEPTEPQGQAEFLTEEDGEAIIAALRGRE